MLRRSCHGGHMKSMVRGLRAKISRVLGPAQACPATSVPLDWLCPSYQDGGPVAEDQMGAPGLS